MHRSGRDTPSLDWDRGAMLDGTNARLPSTRRNARRQDPDRRRIAPHANVWTLFHGIRQSPCATSRDAAEFPAGQDQRWSDLHVAIAVLAMQRPQAGPTPPAQSLDSRIDSSIHLFAPGTGANNIKLPESQRTAHSIRNPAAWFEPLDLSPRAGSNMFQVPLATTRASRASRGHFSFGQNCPRARNLLPD